jgi:SSS family solute:Na+ symporter
MKFVSSGGLYQYLQSVQGYLAPPITAVFRLGLFFKRINARGAVWGLCLGFGLGMLKLTVPTLAGAGLLGETGFLASVGSLNFLYASGWLFLISVLVVVGASLTAPAQSAKEIEGLTFSSITPEQREENRRSWGAIDVAATVGVLVLVFGVYVYFSFWV